MDDVDNAESESEYLLSRYDLEQNLFGGQHNIRQSEYQIYFTKYYMWYNHRFITMGRQLNLVI